jgi:hypothetical protein
VTINWPAIALHIALLPGLTEVWRSKRLIQPNYESTAEVLASLGAHGLVQRAPTLRETQRYKRLTYERKG